MRVFVYCQLQGIYLRHFRKMVSELEILATRDIPHDEKVKALLTDPAVKDRQIRVHIGAPFFYEVMDYGHNEEGKTILLGMKRYDSSELEAATTP